MIRAHFEAVTADLSVADDWLSGTGVFLCGLVITWVVSESDNTDTIRKLSRHVSYILVSR